MIPFVCSFLLNLLLLAMLYRNMGGQPLVIRKKARAVQVRPDSDGTASEDDEVTDEVADQAEVALIDRKLRRTHPQLTAAQRSAAVKEIMEKSKGVLGRIGSPEAG